MNGQQIGIKLADGSFYPVLGEQKAGRRRLVVTTARDNQDTVQIDLYAGEGELAEQTQYVGSLTVENIQPAPKREPEIEVILGLDEQGILEATASDMMTGESRSLSVSLPQAGAGSGATEFELESEGAASPGTGPGEEQEDSLLTGESYPVAETDRRKEHLRRKRRSPLLLIGFIILSLILIAAIAFLVFRVIDGRPIPPLLGRKTEAAGTAAEAESPDVSSDVPAGPAAGAEAQEETAQAITGETDGGEGSPAAAPKQETGQAAVAEGETARQGAVGGLWYEIKWGDTLWDIAATYYRNPWLYPKIAKANQISNPDLIFAGTKLFIPQD